MNRAKLVKQIEALNNAPSEDKTAWLLGAADSVEFMKRDALADDIVIWASASHVLIHGVLAPAEKTTPPDFDDLRRMMVFPDASWGIEHVSGGGEPDRVYLSPPLSSPGCKSLVGGEKLIFKRGFEGMNDYVPPIEISQKLVHSLRLHFVAERHAYCKLNDQGDLEDIINIVNITNGWGDRDGTAITIRAEELYEYMVLSGTTLIRKFDFTRTDKNFSSWSNDDRSEEQDASLSYHCGKGAAASFCNGVQVISAPFTYEDVLQKYMNEREGVGRRYVPFIIHDWRNKHIVETSGAPGNLTNYFTKTEGLPFEVSPAFFRPEVLHKYKADPEKYKIENRSISCRGAWHLETYDINSEGQVHSYIIYLSRLPYEEQLYWKSFNEPPKGPISARAIQTDFEGVWSTEYDPLENLKRHVRALDELAPAWWNPRRDGLISVVHLPATDSVAEWADEIHKLDQMLVEGFLPRPLRELITAKGGAFEQPWGSLRLLEEVFVVGGMQAAEAKAAVEPLKRLHALRTPLKGHGALNERKALAAEARAQFGSFRAHFTQLAAGCDTALKRIIDELLPRSDIAG